MTQLQLLCLAEYTQVKYKFSDTSGGYKEYTESCPKPAGSPTIRKKL